MKTKIQGGRAGTEVLDGVACYKGIQLKIPGCHNVGHLCGRRHNYSIRLAVLVSCLVNFCLVRHLFCFIGLLGDGVKVGIMIEASGKLRREVKCICNFSQKI